MNNNGKPNSVSVATLIECVKAAHLSTYVSSEFNHSSGLFMVGPPGVLKTTIVSALDLYESVLTLSDVNTKTLTSIIKAQLTTNSIKTLVFTEVQRLYERDPRTASGIEGTIRSLVEEGYRGASWEDPTVTRFVARACVIGAMTDKFRDEHWPQWTDSGFARRFMWVLVRLKDPAILMNAVEMGRLAEVRGEVVSMPTPQLGTIPPLQGAIRKRLRPLVRKQPHPANVQYEMLCRMLAVLVYYYEKAKTKKDPVETIVEFGNALLGGAEVTGLVI